MIKTVVRLEWLLRSRRDQFRPLLSCYIVCLYVDCCAVYYWVLGNNGIFPPPAPGRSGRFIAAGVALVWLQQWLLPFLLAPPLLANALATEKAKGMLPLLFATSLTSGELILGKFLGRVYPLVLMTVAHWPFWGLLVGLLGLDPLSAAVLTGATLLPVLGVSAASLVASVWCRKTADALVALYALFAIGILGSWWGALPDGFAPFGQNYLLEPIWDGPDGSLELGRRAVIAIAAWGSIAVGCLGLACWRLRAGERHQPEIRGRRFSSRRPAVDDQPIRWKECYREHRMPLAFFRYIPTWFGLLGVFAGTVGLILWSLWPSEKTFAEMIECLWRGDFQTLVHGLQSTAQSGGFPFALAFLRGLGMLLLAALMVGVRCAAAISEERERGTWELLLLTPLSTPELVHGKVDGILRSARPYLAAYALAAVPLAWLAGQGELLATLMTLLPAWPILSAAGAVGIHQSARATNSGRSILDTVRILIGAAFATLFVSNFVLGCLGLAVLGLANLVQNWVRSFALLDWLGLERRYQPGFCFLLALASLWCLCFWQASREYLAKAVAWIDQGERSIDRWPVARRDSQKVDDTTQAADITP